MGRIIGLILLVAALWASIQFVRQWRSSPPKRAGTGRIANKRPPTAKTLVRLAQIAQNPARYENKRVTITGRVQGAVRYVANGTMYLLVDGNSRLPVIADKKPPQENEKRTVTGVVKVIRAPWGGLQYAYLVDLKKGVSFDPPKWTEIARFFTEKYQKVKTRVEEGIKKR
ncbi:MAG: hypothetical protein M3347_12150, partial [Armatimonadota bacterium]|nr:hypothetical protein [Armatimonadota bacterium]